MPKYVLMSRVAPEGLKDRDTIERLNARIGAQVREEVPGVRWLDNYTILGPYDYLDIFEAPDNEAAARVALIVRSLGHARTEIWPAMDWERFRDEVAPENHLHGAPARRDPAA
jgi:uncharacterized protein with GYD domain